MIGHWQQAQHAIVPESGLQALDQPAQAFAGAGRQREQRRVDGGHHDDLMAGQLQRVGRRTQPGDRQLFAQQQDQAVGIAGGVGGLQFDDRGRDVVVQREQFDAAGGGMAGAQPAAQGQDEPACPEQQRLGVLDLRQQLEPGLEDRRRLEPLAGFGHPAEGAIEFGEQAASEAARHTRTGQLHQLLQGVRAQ